MVSLDVVSNCNFNPKRLSGWAMIKQPPNCGQRATSANVVRNVFYSPFRREIRPDAIPSSGMVAVRLRQRVASNTPSPPDQASEESESFHPGPDLQATRGGAEKKEG